MVHDRAFHLARTKRIVIKIGSTLLTSGSRKGIQTPFLKHLAEQVEFLRGRGIECLIVSSGAIAAGLHELGFTKRPKEISELQALAAVGQSNLMRAYEVTFKRYGMKVAQILLTRDDLSNRHRYSNAHNTLITLFRHGIVPIVNENDTVAVEEIKFGDNDTLGVLVTHLCEADLLVLMTDIDGLYDEDPKLNPSARLIPEVHRLDGSIEKGASRSNSLVGTGGMLTKVRAARSMMQSGVPMAIVNGRTRNILKRTLAGEQVGTFFHPRPERMTSRRRWLAWSVKPKGDVVIDAGAVKAILETNKSLLPSGVRKTAGAWGRGDIVRIVGLDGRELAKGISNYSSQELDLIKGLKTSEASRILGLGTADEVVHRDNMVRIETN